MVVETQYYDLLEVSPAADALTIKKAYRRAAIRHHPERTAKFQAVGQAYQVLSDPELRRRYDRYGPAEARPEAGFADAGEFFQEIFGGEAFCDLIGEISLIRDMSRAMEIAANEPSAAAAAAGAAADGADTGRSAITAGVDTPASGTDTDARPKKGGGLTRQQRAELEAYEAERQRVRQERIGMLARKLADRLSVWAEAEPSPAVTDAFQQKIRYEAESLKMESFGIELLHTIGATYLAKAGTYLKSQRFLGVGGLIGKLREKGAMAKETWNTLSSVIDAQIAADTMAKLEEKGGEAWSSDRRAEMEADVTGKLLMAGWRGTKLEVNSVLRAVCDAVLHDKKVSPAKRLARAQALLMIGSIFKSTQRDAEEMEGQRVFEELLAQQQKKKKRSG